MTALIPGGPRGLCIDDAGLHSEHAAKVFRYVVAYDYGTAPRPYGSLCTLAICKPKIRAAARPGDWVIGFRSRHPGDVIYAMQVGEVLGFAEYWADPRFADRRPGATSKPDNIYRPGPHGLLEQVSNDIHGPHDARRDLGGQRVLVSHRFWYFGRNSVPLPNHLMHLVHTTQGHAVYKNRKSSDVRAIREWLAAWPPGRHGPPVESDDVAAEEHEGETPGWPSAVPPAPVVAKRAAARCGSRRAEPMPQPINAPPQRLVLSRKGFDSGYGGMPSPILPDGRILPLPIPARHDDVRLGSVGHEQPEAFAALISDLSGGRHSVDTRVHLDPDLDPLARVRPAGWRPALGQTGAAQTHLARQGVGAGDVFLFFGWFREVERWAGRWRYARSAPHLHALFGWLEIDEILAIVANRDASLVRHPWAATHVHAENPAHYTNALNNLYIAPARSRLVAGRAGGGQFHSFSSALQLTAPRASRSVWDVPEWLGPEIGRLPLSYHAAPARWQRRASGWRLKTAAKGQEFVCDLAGRDAALPWLTDLIKTHTQRNE